MSEQPKGLSIIKNVMDELHILISQYGLHAVKNKIVNVTELIKANYTEDISHFKVLTSQICFIIDKTYYQSCLTQNGKESYALIIFADNKAANLAQINLSDMIGLFDVDLSTYKYLSKCTFHFNTMYHKDQFDMIPAIRYTHHIL